MQLAAHEKPAPPQFCAPARSALIPACRDPFVNTPLLSLTADSDGVPRFWICSWNASTGALGVLLNADGKARFYRFNSPQLPGFYSAVQTAEHTLWLCGDLAQLLRLDLDSGEFTVYPTGAPNALVFSGMSYDSATGKLFAVAFPYAATTALSFDTNSGKTVAIHTLSTNERYMRCSHRNPDGSHTIQLQHPGLTMLRWHPSCETVDQQPIASSLERNAGTLLYRMIAADNGRLYLPGFGWYDPASGKLDQRWRHTDDRTTWFARDATHAYGLQIASNVLQRWELASNQCENIVDCTSYGFNHLNIALTGNQQVVGFSRSACFSRLNCRDGGLEISRQVPAIAVQAADCVIRIDADRILGTPFISQRFWELDLRSGNGYDCGLAAPGGGQIARLWKINGKIYLAAYAGAELTEYDPAIHPHFPDNPHVVAKPPAGMRPVGAADDGCRIFYSCSQQYGNLGSVLVSYNCQTGFARYHNNPLPEQQIRTMAYVAADHTLLCGTSIYADCHSANPSADDAVIASIDADSLQVLQQCSAPAGAVECRVCGPLDEQHWLLTVSGRFATDEYSHRWLIFNRARFQTPTLADLQPFPTATPWVSPQYAGYHGHFVVSNADKIELWDLRQPQRCCRVLATGVESLRFRVQQRDLLLWDKQRIYLLENIL